MRLILGLCIIVLLASCKKQRLSTFKGTSYLKGKFEWVYSYGSNNESESFETIDDRYAMRFKKSGTVEVFKNGERISKGYVSNIGGVYKGSRTVHLYLDDIGEIVMFTDENTIEYTSFPIVDHTNIFQKQ